VVRGVRLVSEIMILHDGWSLAYEPNGPAAIHLHTLLNTLSEDFRFVVALPARPVDSLPGGVMAQVIDTPPTPRARLIWEQHTLARWAKKAGAGLVHLVSGGPALFSAGLNVVSPAGAEFSTIFANSEDRMQPPDRRKGLETRLRSALLHGGLFRASGVIWPADLPELKVGIPLFKLPPAVPAAFWDESQAAQNLEGIDLPESYILCHGPSSESDLRGVLDAWSWASPALGEYISLVLLGLDRETRAQLALLAGEYQLDRMVIALPEISLVDLAEVYRRSSALFHINPISPWGDPLRLALACGKPIVGLENPISDALVGPAAYLVRPGGSPKATARALGAALVTVLGEEYVAEQLANEAKKRSAAWKAAEPQFRDELSFVYLKLINP
jgi:glycosyltransferase involved in cell wall biosynthesis